MLRKVYLHGHLGRKYGWRHELDVATPCEAITAISANRRGFREAFWRGPGYTFVRGATRRNGVCLELPEVGMQLGKDDFHIIPAISGAGGDSGGKGVGKVILGVAAIGAAFFTAGATAPATFAIGASEIGVAGAAGGMAFGGAAAGWGATAFSLPLIGSVTAGNLAAVGGLMALGGISQLITQQPRAAVTGGASTYGGREAPAARQSFLYNGPANTMEQGGPVPIVYGQMRVGSVLLSGAIQNEDVPVS